MEKFFLHQKQIAKGATTTGQKSFSSLKAKHADLQFWAWETMNRKMGPLRAKHIRDSKILPEFGCGVTGSREFDHRTWAVAID